METQSSGRIYRVGTLSRDGVARVFVLRIYEDRGEWCELRNGENRTGIHEPRVPETSLEDAVIVLESKAKQEWPGIVIN